MVCNEADYLLLRARRHRESLYPENQQMRWQLGARDASAMSALPAEDQG
ncbi:MAG TPA: hypothetical protein VGL63_06605 [Streptosporangiaceae bacterium]